jgi:hypothetical protein
MADGAKPLAPEADLFAVLFRESIARGDVVIRPAEVDAAGRVRDLGRGHETHALWIGSVRQDVDFERVVLSQMVVAGPAPTLIDGRGEVVLLDAETPVDAWAEVALALLHRWV